jgi:hypothetical protein
MLNVQFRYTGERTVALRFDKFPEVARAKFVEIVTVYQAQLQAAIAAKLPRGRTGRIAAALAGGVESTQYKVRGWVSLQGGDLKTVILPAMALEYGSNTAVKVSAKSGRGLRTVYGREVTPMQVAVGAYSRQTNIVAQRFLRGPLSTVADSFQAALEQGLIDAAAEGA